MQTSTQPVCCACGEPVDLKNKGTLVETIGRQGPDEKEGIVWHRDCFNQFLDEGEET